MGNKKTKRGIALKLSCTNKNFRKAGCRFCPFFFQRRDLTFRITVRQEKRHLEIQKPTCDFKRARPEAIYSSD